MLFLLTFFSVLLVAAPVEEVGIYASPTSVAPAPKLADKAKASQDPGFQELLRVIQDKAFQKQMSQKLAALGSKLKFPQVLAKWHKDNPKLTVTQLALNLAGVDIKAKSVLAGHSQNLCNRATPYAQAMANADQSNNHSGIEKRWAGTTQYQEIVQGGYPLYAGNKASLLQAARDCFHTPERKVLVGNVETTYQETGWKTSDKHWKAATDSFKSFCYDMRKSKTGAYYCVGSFSKND